MPSRTRDQAVATKRQTDLPEARRAAVSLFCALVLAGMTALFWFGMEGSFRWVALAPGALTLLMVYGAVHASLGIGAPRTEILIEGETLQRGVSASVRLIQHGPIFLDSLRVNLVCEVREKPAGGTRRDFYPVQENVFEALKVEVTNLPMEFAFQARPPLESEPSQRTPGKKVDWRLEVWGKRSGKPDFMRPFELEVS